MKLSIHWPDGVLMLLPLKVMSELLLLKLSLLRRIFHNSSVGVLVLAPPPTLALFYSEVRLFAIGVKAEEFLADVAESCLMKVGLWRSGVCSVVLQYSSKPLLAGLELELMTRGVTGRRVMDGTRLRWVGCCMGGDLWKAWFWGLDSIVRFLFIGSFKGEENFW